MHKIMLLFCSLPSVIACLSYCRLQKSVTLLKELQMFFEQLAIHLSATAVEIYPLLNALQKKGICAELCRQIRSFMDEDMSFELAWGQALKQCFHTLSPSFIVELMIFGAQFGFGSVDKQITLCEKYKNFCSEQIAAKNDYIKNNGKLTLTCSVLFGAFLYVIML